GRACEDAAARKLSRDPSIRGSNCRLAAKATGRARVGLAIRNASEQLRPHWRRTMPADFPCSIGSIPGSGNAVSLAPTCTREEDRVNQAAHLDACVAKAPEGTGALWWLDVGGKPRLRSLGHRKTGGLATFACP